MLTEYKKKAVLLLAHKVCSDYFEAKQAVDTIEPEHFCEQWIQTHIVSPDAFFKEGIWRAFLQRLVVRYQYTKEK